MIIALDIRCFYSKVPQLLHYLTFWCFFFSLNTFTSASAYRHIDRASLSSEFHQNPPSATTVALSLQSVWTTEDCGPRYSSVVECTNLIHVVLKLILNNPTHRHGGTFLKPHPQVDRGRRINPNSNPAWSTTQVLGQPGI